MFIAFEQKGVFEHRRHHFLCSVDKKYCVRTFAKSHKYLTGVQVNYITRRVVITLHQFVIIEQSFIICQNKGTEK